MTDGARILLEIIRGMNEKRYVVSWEQGTIIKNACVSTQEEIAAVVAELQAEHDATPETVWGRSWYGGVPMWLSRKDETE